MDEYAAASPDLGSHSNIWWAILPIYDVTGNKMISIIGAFDDKSL